MPLIAGWNQDEGTSTIVKAPEKGTMDGLRATAVKEFGPRAEDFLKVYHANDDAEALRVADDFCRRQLPGLFHLGLAGSAGKTGGSPVYRYLFALPSPGDPFHPVSAGAFHSDEIEYVFGNLDSRKGAQFRPEDYKLSDLMQTYWTNFARTGDPNGDRSAASGPNVRCRRQLAGDASEPGAGGCSGPASRSLSFSAAGLGAKALICLR